MKLSGNTILITGGGSGIGRGLAEALHRLGNQVIISGRRQGNLAAMVDANPGMHSVELDVMNPTNIAAVTTKLIAEFPKLNVLINNAGIMQPDQAAGRMDDALLVATIKLFSTEVQIAPSPKSWRYQSSVRRRGGKPPTPSRLKEYTMSTMIGR